MSFKVQVKFYIPLFEVQIYAYTLEKWLSLVKGYFIVQFFSNNEKITFALLKYHPHVRYWCEIYYEKHVGDEYEIPRSETSWEAFVDAIKEKYYPVGNYDD
jgi:hypothetical protein